MKITTTIIAATLVGAAAPAAAANLIANGGFETGTFDNWIVGGGSGAEGVSTLPGVAHSGDAAAILGSTFAHHNLAQSVATVSGSTYKVSFWLLNRTVFGFVPENRMLVSVGNTILEDFQDAAPFGWTGFDHSFVATSDETFLNFYSRNVPSFWHLDDVSVEAVAPPPPVGGVPEPASWALMIGGFAGVGSAMRRRRTSAVVG